MKTVVRIGLGVVLMIITLMIFKALGFQYESASFYCGMFCAWLMIFSGDFTEALFKK